MMGSLQPAWAAQYNTWLLIKLTPKGVLFSFISSLQPCAACSQIAVERPRSLHVEQQCVYVLL